MSPSKNSNFIIFSPARCGSTVLMLLLNLYPKVRCINEPFNILTRGGKYNNLAKDRQSLDCILGELWTDYSGIKHVWFLNGKPFRCEEDLNIYLLLRPNQRILFLNRKNDVARIVSNWVAQHTNIWFLSKERHRERLANFAFPPISSEYVRFNLQMNNSATHKYREVLEDNKCEFLELWYEDLFGENIGELQKTCLLKIITTFLHFSEITDQSKLERVTNLFNPLKMKMGTRQLYERIPGLDEIEREFGAL